MGVKPDAYEKDIAAPRCLLLLAPLLSSFSILSSNFISPVISYSYSYSYAVEIRGSAIGAEECSGVAGWSRTGGTGDTVDVSLVRRD